MPNRGKKYQANISFRNVGRQTARVWHSLSAGSHFRTHTVQTIILNPLSLYLVYRIMKAKEWVYLGVLRGLFAFAHPHHRNKKQHVPVTSDSFTTCTCFLRQYIIVFVTSSLWFPQQLQKHCGLLTKQMNLRHGDEGHSFPEFSSRKDHCSKHRRAF